MPAPPLLECAGIDKSFHGVRVLREVSFRLLPGRTLGLVGENGAGKSTLMNILGGNLEPDAGRLRLAGQDYRPRNPQEASGCGVAFIHQELNLFPNLSVAENIFLTAFPRWPISGWPFIDRRAIRARTRALLEEVGLAIGPDTLVERLSPGERQLVEIAKALSLEARLLILDEPTTSLSARETQRLFSLLTRLQGQGMSMIYISHRLEDVLDLCQDLVVLRDGEVVGQGPRGDFSLDQLITLMVGRSIQQLFPTRPETPAAAAVLEVRGLSQPGMVANVNFELHRHEVLGIAGLMGSGRSELARILFGLDPFARGEIRLAGRRRERVTPRRSIQQRVAFLTENRREEGLCFEASIADNIALVSLPAFRRTGSRLIDRPRLAEAVKRMRREVRLTVSARDDQPVKSLSGGNQQKVVLAKWLLNEPAVFILDEPTRGIDVGAKFEVYHLINTLAGQGAGILVISSEIEELIGLCDRILVMSHGEIRDNVDRPHFDRERILRAALEVRATA